MKRLMMSRVLCGAFKGGMLKAQVGISAAFLVAVTANWVKQSLSSSLRHFLSLNFHTISDDNEALVSLNTPHNILVSVVPL